MNTFTVIIKVIRWRGRVWGGGVAGSRFFNEVTLFECSYWNYPCRCNFLQCGETTCYKPSLLPLPPPFLILHYHHHHHHHPLSIHPGGSYALKAAMLHSSRTGNVYLILGGFSHFSRENLVKDRRLILLMAQTETGWNESEIKGGKVPTFSCRGFRVYEI